MERIGAIIACLVLLSCARDPYFGPIGLEPDSTAIDSSASMLWIGCEGNFQFGNASLSVFDLEEETVQNDVYRSVNNRPIGDVFQSMYQHGDSLFCVVNNSGLIRILDAHTYREIDVIEGLQSPRHVLVFHDAILITDLYSKKVTVVDLHSLALMDEISLGDWTEDIVRVGDQIVVADVNGMQLIVLDADFQWVSNIELDIEPRFMVSNDNRLVVGGNQTTTGSSGIIYDFSSTLELTDTFQVPALVDLDLVEDQLFTLHSTRVGKYDVPSKTLETSWGTPSQTNYSVRVDAQNERVYVADVKDYVSKGSIHVYDLAEGSWVNTFDVGFIPQSMIFTF